jgi:hypothetical protein
MTAQLINQPNVPWCAPADVLALPWFSGLKAEDTDTLLTLCTVASAWMWRASGQQFPGPCDTTVRPVPRWAHVPSLGLGMGPNPSPQYFDSRGGRYGWPLPFGRGEYAFEIELGHWPARSVGQVVIDGAIFTQSAAGQLQWRLDDARWLTRTDGQSWPYWQDWTKPSAPAAAPDQTGTWEVTLTWGADPPPDGGYAATILAGELTLAASNGSSCRLPNRVQSMARQGTSMLLVDPQTLLASGKWGIQEIDMFVMSANPNKLMFPSMMLSPDLPRVVRRAGTMPGS